MKDAETSIPPDVAELAKTHAAHAHGLFADSRVKRNLGIIIYDAIVAAISADRSRCPSDEAGKLLREAELAMAMAGACLFEPEVGEGAREASRKACVDAVANIIAFRARITPTGETE